jgi:hypothetical protein
MNIGVLPFIAVMEKEQICHPLMPFMLVHVKVVLLEDPHILRILRGLIHNLHVGVRRIYWIHWYCGLVN